MRYIVYILFSLFLFMGLSSARAQQLFFETGGNTTSFKFTPTPLSTSFSKPFTSRIAGGLLLPLGSENFKLITGVAYDTHKIESTYSNNNLPISFDLEFLSAQAGLQWTVLRIKDLEFQFESGLSYNWLMFGRQVDQADVVDLTTAVNTKTEGLNYQFGFGVDYPITDDVAVYARYGINNSLNAFTNEYDDKLTLDSRSVNVGIKIKIRSRRLKQCEDISDTPERLLLQRDSIYMPLSTGLDSIENERLDDLEERIDALEKSCKQKEQKIDSLLQELKCFNDQTPCAGHKVVKSDSEAMQTDAPQVLTDENPSGSNNTEPVVEHSKVAKSDAAAMQKDALQGLAEENPSHTVNSQDLDNRKLSSVGDVDHVAHSVSFGFDSDLVEVSDFEQLNDIAKVLFANPNLKISIAGYADITGDDQYNYYLSERRANSVKRFLMEYGVVESQCEIIIRGETEEFGQEKHLNRRCVLSFIK